MSDEERLYRQIVDDPDDDAPRISYADLMDRAGDPRGRFIRAQLELAGKLKSDAPTRAWRGVFQEASELQKRHRDAWLEPLRTLLDRGLVRTPRFLRGFVEYVAMDAPQFLDHSDELYAAAPIRHLALTNVRPVMRVLFGSPELQRLVSLTLDNVDLRDDGAALLAAAPPLPRLAWIDLGRNKLGRAALDALAAATATKFPALQYVVWNGNEIDDPAEHASGEVDDLVVTATALGDELERSHGPLRWLHYPSRRPGSFPPVFDAIAP